MYKTLAAAALAGIASAKGDDNGNGFDNYKTYTVVNGLNLNLYNAVNDGTSELHGEVVWASNADAKLNREQGWCFRKVGAEGTWDCMVVKANVDPAAIEDDPTKGREFIMTDGYSTDGTRANYENDDEWNTNSASKNFRFIASKSSKEPCIAGSTAGTAACQTTAHWYRNFETDQAVQDIKLEATADGAAQLYDVKGWFFDTDNQYYQKQESDTLTESSAPVQVNMVFQAYVDALTGGTAPTDNSSVVDPEPAPEGDNDEDGATSVTTFGAAVLAAIAALAF